MFLKLALFFFLALGASSRASVINGEISPVWSNYKLKYNKTYPSIEAEKTAKNNYDKSYFSIMIHNSAYEKGLISYKLSVNQFSDMSFDHIRSMFPKTVIPLNKCNNTHKFTKRPLIAEEFDYTKNGFKIKVHDQGLKCNSGWAYAAATALQIFRAVGSSMEVTSTVSAQHLIDCAGQTNSCKNQTSLGAFSYLMNAADNSIYDEVDYPNTPWLGRGNCLHPQRSSNDTYLLYLFYTLCNIDISLLTHIIQNISPVVIDFSALSFEFFHYSEGIFTPPTNTIVGSHYMTVVGYGIDSNGTKYWKLQNSFGKSWGDKGYIRLSHKDSKILSCRALFPTLLILNVV